MSQLEDIKVILDVRLGKKELSLKEVNSLGEGSVIELDKYSGEVVDVFINDKLVAFGEVVVVDDKFGIRISDIIEPEEKENIPFEVKGI